MGRIYRRAVMDFHYYSKKKEDDLDFFRLDLRSVLLLLSQSTKIEKKVHRTSLLHQ